MKWLTRTILASWLALATVGGVVTGGKMENFVNSYKIKRAEDTLRLLPRSYRDAVEKFRETGVLDALPSQISEAEKSDYEVKKKIVEEWARLKEPGMIKKTLGVSNGHFYGGLLGLLILGAPVMMPFIIPKKRDSGDNSSNHYSSPGRNYMSWRPPMG